METYKVFDDCQYKVVRFHCDDETVYKNDTFVKGLDDLFSQPDLDPQLLDQNGKGLSTFRLEQYWLMDVPGIAHFEKFFTEKAIEACEIFGKPGATGVRINRCWTNKIWKGCSGNVHDHDPESDAIAVFYPLAPGNSADLGLVRNTRNHATNDEIKEGDVVWQNIKEGDLVLHETRTWHTVSEHKDEHPRIVFVLEFSYT